MTQRPHTDAFAVLTIWVTVVLAIQYGCDMREARGETRDKTFRGLAIGGWRSSSPRMSCGPCGCGPNGCNPQALPSPSQQRSQCQPATVRIVHKSDDGRGTSGNGTLIAIDDSRGARRGLVITCAHIQQQDWRPSIILARSK